MKGGGDQYLRKNRGGGLYYKSSTSEAPIIEPVVLGGVF